MNSKLIKKLRDCKSENEVRQFLSDNRKELDDLSLEMVTGGTSAQELAEMIEEDRSRREEESKNIEFLIEMLRRLSELQNKNASE